MKKQLLLSSVLFITTFAMAQIKPTFGIRAGAAVSGVQGDAMKSLNNVLNLSNGLLKTGNRTGLFAGGYISLPLSEKIAVSPGLYYAQEGASVKGNLAFKAISLLGITAGTHLHEDFVELPVLLNANLNGFQVFAGPQLSYLAGANLKTTAGAFGINVVNKTVDVTSQFNRWNAGVTGGVGYEFANGVNLTATYDQGLSKIDANKSTRAYNHSFKVGIGFRF